jgi:hypothetical protein
MEMAMISKEQIRPEKMLDPRFSLGNYTVGKIVTARLVGHGEVVGRVQLGVQIPVPSDIRAASIAAARVLVKSMQGKALIPSRSGGVFCLCIFQAWTLGVDSMPCAVCRDPGRWALSSLVIRCAKSIDQSMETGTGIVTPKWKPGWKDK